MDFLANRGHIAKVGATEIWCPKSTGDFYKHYLTNKTIFIRIQGTSDYISASVNY
jgi:hypothetical protein